jgi:hypothetical protein
VNTTHPTDERLLELRRLCDTRSSEPGEGWHALLLSVIDELVDRRRADELDEPQTLEDVRRVLRDTLIDTVTDPSPWTTDNVAAVRDFADTYVKLGGDLELPAPDPQPRALEAELRVAALEDAARNVITRYRNMPPARRADFDITTDLTPLRLALGDLAETLDGQP